MLNVRHNVPGCGTLCGTCIWSPTIFWDMGGDALSLELELVECLFRIKCILRGARRLSILICANPVLTEHAAHGLRERVRFGT